jgi:hypothetical protein
MILERIGVDGYPAFYVLYARRRGNAASRP